nr:ras-like GTP-binding protein O-RHO [Saimiri boliviensis boliviensis]
MCLLFVFSKDQFPAGFAPRVFQNDVAHIEVDGTRVELTVWDTARQEDDDGLRPLFDPDTGAYWCVSSLTTLRAENTSRSHGVQTSSNSVPACSSSWLGTSRIFGMMCTQGGS